MRRFKPFVVTVLLLATACGQAKAGSALPKGDDLSTYLSAKFESVINQLQDTLEAATDITSSLDTRLSIDEKTAEGTLTATRVGSPESRVLRNRSLKNPDDILDSFTPAEGSVVYLFHGAAYHDLAPTPWVSTPKPNDETRPCNWSGLGKPCRMAKAVAIAYQQDRRTLKSVKGAADGGSVLVTNVPFGTFLDAEVTKLPPNLFEKISEDLKKSMIPTTITLDPDGHLVSFLMDGRLDGGGHHVEVHYDFKFTGKATPQDLPQIPDPAQVTVLDQAGTDDYYRRLEAIRNASGG